MPKLFVCFRFNFISYFIVDKKSAIHHYVPSNFTQRAIDIKFKQKPNSLTDVKFVLDSTF